MKSQVQALIVLCLCGKFKRTTLVKENITRVVLFVCIFSDDIEDRFKKRYLILACKETIRGGKGCDRMGHKDDVLLDGLK